MSDALQKHYLTRPGTARRYDVTERSIARWQDDPGLGFPKPMIVNNRLFFAVDELEAWERGRASAKGVSRPSAASDVEKEAA